ncbi:hypothetical protein AC579_6386 [Pseudocercospora musae]|uniref:NTF2 domain-containing protein n=1 Tax=Pseudocercospora musae TaxID=113226 RepID=A0A139IJA1_9PEZI|nr:hypothetical protein AC579_6386 [Pseudocercospora musae]
MASEVAGMPNGTYAPHQAYSGIDQNNHAYASNAQAPQQASQQAPPTSSTPSNAQQAQQPDIPKDEVGWYFVEQYYTTLSRSPEKLYLFYNKRSQFVSGQETDKVAVCVGQRAINDKIKDLDFQDCKVRVTNVDSQASDTNIVIQVIGELSNRGQPHRKFTQTFVLATQTNGYFVLNDIFRYLVEEEDEPEAETQQPAEEVQQVSGTESGFQERAPTEAGSKTLTSSADSAAVEKDAQEADKEIEEKLVNNLHDVQGAVPAVTNGEHVSEEPAAVEKEPSESTEAGKPSAVEAPTAAEVDIEPEKPKDPEPTPVKSPPAQAQASSPAVAALAPKPAAPAAPKTWASLAASANRVATPAAAAAAAAAAPATRPAPKAATPTAPAQPASSSTSSAPSAPAAQRQEAQGSDSQDEWTAVSSSHNRQQSRQANSLSQPEESANRGYIKNVSDNVEHNKLRAELEKFGKVAYFDIARQKNCAFVDFDTSEGYNKALNTPFKIGDDELYVEKRHIRPGQTPYIPRGQFQGGRGGGGRGGAGQGAPRGNYQGGRGNSNGAPRGRGGFQSQRGTLAALPKAFCIGELSRHFRSTQRTLLIEHAHHFCASRWVNPGETQRVTALVQELLAWLNGLLQLNLTKVEQCGTGAALVQVYDSIFLDAPLGRIKFDAKSEYAYLENFKILSNLFRKHHIDRPIPVEQLVKCKMQDNLEFLQWTKRYWDQYYPGGDYDAVGRRKGVGGAAPSPSMPSARTSGATAATRKPAGGLGAAAPRASSRQAGGPATAALQQKNAELMETVGGLERERDFYFSKLRDIELLIQQAMDADPSLEEDENSLLKQIQTILYSTEEGFEIPQEADAEVAGDEETF